METSLSEVLLIGARSRGNSAHPQEGPEHGMQHPVQLVVPGNGFCRLVDVWCIALRE